jgi:hypothetical protein
MKANELRIGNWMMHSETNEYFQWDTFNFKFDIYDNNINYIFQPIPLTEEWLLKFGLGSNNEYPLKLLCGYIKIRNGVWFFKYNKLDIELQYVHQLQNLYFVLTGNELNLK